VVKNLPVVPTAKAGSLAEAPAGTNCLQQYPVISEGCDSIEVTLFCPDSALKVEDGKVVHIMKLCKGCGICANECKDIQMAPAYTGARGVFR
jgi:pyruvate ferredoxin oxidoreductase delta subunit